MPVLSNTMILVTLPSGNRAVYEVQPQHMNPIPGTNLAERARMWGIQRAVENDGRWFHSGLRREIADLRTIALLERCMEARPEDL